MSYKKLENPFKLYKAEIQTFDGNKCVKPRVVVKEIIVTHYSMTLERFKYHNTNGNPEITSILCKTDISHLRPESSCPWYASDLYWPTRAKALQALRSDETLKRRKKIDNTKEKVSKLWADIEAAEKDLRAMIKMFKDFK